MIAVVGEALVDLVADGDGRTFHAYPGGSPANVAAGLARLDLPVEMLARLASDTLGRQLRGHLHDNGVALTYAVAAAEPASLALVTLDEAGAATYDFRVQGTADWQWAPGELPEPPPSGLSAVHTGSLVAALEPGASVLEEWLRSLRATGAVTLCFDPNLRPGLMGDPGVTRTRVERQIGLAHVVKVSEDDLLWTHPDESYVEVARRWLAGAPSAAEGLPEAELSEAERPSAAPALVVVTRGAEGAYAATRLAEVEVSAPPISLVDSVGAGDAFTAGLLAGLGARGLLGRGSGQRLAEVDPGVVRALVDEAALVAALTCARAGADPPTRADVDAWRP